MSRIIIFSHDSNIDGIGNIILAKLAFTDLDYVLVSNEENLKITFEKYLELNILEEYEQIIVTDLLLDKDSLLKVSASELNNKFLMFNSKDNDLEDKKCGTNIFYKYLLDNNLLEETPALNTFVEYTRLVDTDEWKKKNIGPLAHSLSILFSAIGNEEYIKTITTKLKENFYFDYTLEEINIINSKKEEIN